MEHKATRYAVDSGHRHDHVASTRTHERVDWPHAHRISLLPRPRGARRGRACNRRNRRRSRLLRRRRCRGAARSRRKRRLRSGHAAQARRTRLSEQSPEFDASFAYHFGLSKPVIAAINGPAAGVGLALACFADLRFAAAGIKMTTAHGKLNLPAEYGLSWLLPRMIGLTRANELLLTSRAFFLKKLSRGDS